MVKKMVDENEKLIKSLSKVSGKKVPADDTKTYSKVVGAIIETFEVKSPADIMLANRMASTWMKLRYIEEKLKDYDMYWLITDKDGNRTVKMNEMVYYMKQLDAEFRSYYRLLAQGWRHKPKDAEKDFSDLIKDAVEVKDEKKA